MAWLAYCKAHKVIFEQEGSYDLTLVFQQMALDTNHLNSKIHKVQEVWTSQRGLKAANYAAQTSPKDIHFFQVASPSESPNIMGLKGVHSLEAVHWWGSHSFCPWCEKERQNEGTVLNHLRTTHYHLGLVCILYMDFFLTSADAMWSHTHMYYSIAAIEDNDWEEEEYENDDDGDENSEYLFEEA